MDPSILARCPRCYLIISFILFQRSEVPNNKVTVIEDSNDAQKGKEIQHRFVRRQLISETVTTQDTDHAYCIDSLHSIKKSIITNVAK